MKKILCCMIILTILCSGLSLSFISLEKQQIKNQTSGERKSTLDLNTPESIVRTGTIQNETNIRMNTSTVRGIVFVLLCIYTVIALGGIRRSLYSILSVCTLVADCHLSQLQIIHKWDGKKRMASI